MMSRGLVLCAALGIAACASSNVGGGTVDATAEGDAADERDASDPDAAATVDGAPASDAATAIDAALAIDAAMTIDAGTCPTQPCDLHAQCGCTAPLVCDLDFTDLVGTSCRAVNQPGTETSTCSSGSPATAQSSYCAGGFVCVGSGANAVCEKYCDMDADCGQPRGQCVIQLTANNAPIAGATVCSGNCNPVNSSAGGCPAGFKCGFFTVTSALTGNQPRDIVDCALPGTGTQGTACTSDAGCAANFMCVNTGTTACRRICNRTTGGNECAAVPGTTCGGFNPALVVGGAEYGACI